MDYIGNGNNVAKAYFQLPSLGDLCTKALKDSGWFDRWFVGTGAPLLSSVNGRVQASAGSVQLLTDRSTVWYVEVRGFPANCGMVTFSNSGSNIARRHVGTVMTMVTEYAVRVCGYTQILASTNSWDGNKTQARIFARLNWKALDEFTNARSGSKIIVWGKNIREVNYKTHLEMYDAFVNQLRDLLKTETNK